MITAIVIFAIAYLLIASGKIHHALIAIIGGVAAVSLGALTGEEALEHVDLNVILLLSGMMSLAYVVSRTGVFDWAAIKSAQLVGGNGFGVLAVMAVMVGVASAFLDNVTVVVLAVPITLSLARTLQINPIPLLIAQIFASNIGGAATIVGDPPNIIIASAADIGFVEFLLNIAPVSIIGLVALVGLLYVWFRKDIITSETSRQEVMSQNPNDAITDKGLLIKSGIVFSLVVLGFLLQDVIDVDPAFVAIGGAGVLVLISRIDPAEVLEHVEWTTLAFFAGLFILVGGLVETGVIEDIQEALIDLADGNEQTLAFLIIWGSGVASAIVDNIPFTATMTQVVGQLTAEGAAFEVAEGEVSPLWWALVLGADLGGNATIVGASANVIVVTLARANGYPISFVGFLKYGLVISAVTLAISTGYMWLRFFL